VLEKMGQHERAALMLRQAETLRRHDAGADYALARPGAAAATLEGRRALPRPSGAADVSSAWPDALARTDVHETADGMVELRRVAAMASQPPETIPAAVAIATAETASERPVRIEIRNGNGVRGMAAALARTVGSERLRVVRLANEKNFLVERSRIEYSASHEAAARTLALRLGPLILIEEDNCTAADLRLILGHDLTDPAALRRRYLKQLKLAKAALAELD
jgi:hypothetical protein